MPQWRPCKRKVFVKRLRKLNFEGPYSGTRHQFMVHENNRMSIPSNPEYSIPQLRMLLNEVELIIDKAISADDWSSLT